nr:reverse transcriptase domain-containing protein [Tanacetum cinerariifolium]
MTDNRTMAEMLRAACRWLEKEPLRSITTWDDLILKFINDFFPPSRTTNLCNEISNFQQKFDESFHEAWERYKYLLRAYPHHSFTELYQLDTFYNALNPADQDSLNAAAGGNLLEKSPQDALTIIENKSKVRNSRSKPIASPVNACDINSSSEIAKLTHVVNQQTSAVTTAMTAMLKQLQANPPPAQVKADEKIYVTCGGAQPYYQCLAAGGNTFLEFGIISKVTFQQPQATTIRMNTASTLRSGSLPGNTVANLKVKLKAITTRSGLVTDGPTVPTPSKSVTPEEDECVEETYTDPNLVEYTIKVPPPPVQKHMPPQEKDEIQIQKFWNMFKQLHLNITLAEALVLMPKYQKMLKALISNKEKLQELANTPLNENCSAEFTDELALITYPPDYDDNLHFDIESDLREIEFLLYQDALVHMPKFAPMFKKLLNNKDKLIELTKTPLKENCSAVVLKKLPEKLGDPGRFLIPCDFSEFENFLALASLGASINLMPLSIWKKLRLPTLNDTKMVLELADQTISKPTDVAENVFVKVGNFYFLTDFVVLDFIADPRSLTLKCGDTPSISYNSFQSLNKIDFIDARESESDLEEIENFLNDDSIGVENFVFDMEADILFLERLLSEDPFPLAPMNPNQAKSTIEEPEHSFSMGYKHFITTLVTELDEVADSSIKNLVPILRECEVTSDNEIHLNSLFDDDEINSNELESHVESNFVESLSNHDHLEEPLMPICIAEEERIRREHAQYISRFENDDSEGEIDDVEELRIDNSISNSENELSNNESSNSDFDNPSFPRPPPEPPDDEFDFELDAGEEISVELTSLNVLTQEMSLMFLQMIKMMIIFLSCLSSEFFCHILSVPRCFFLFSPLRVKTLSLTPVSPFRAGGKLKSTWYGPFAVSKDMENGAIKLYDEDGNEFIVNKQRVKPYQKDALIVDKDDDITLANERGVKENSKKNKIESKPNKNGKRGEAGKSKKQLQWTEEEKLNKMQKEGPEMQTHAKSTKALKKKERKKG